MRAVKERVKWHMVKRFVGNDDEPPSLELIADRDQQLLLQLVQMLFGCLK